MRAGARLAGMPRLQGRVREVLDRLETVKLGDDVAEFQLVAKAVEARADRERTPAASSRGLRPRDGDGGGAGEAGGPAG